MGKKIGIGCLGLVLAVVAVVAVVSVIAVMGGNSDSNSSVAPAATPKKSVDKNAPRPVSVGKAFVIGKHQMEKGWTLTESDFLEGFEAKGDVTNVSSKVSTAIFHIKVLKGKRVLANLGCASNDLEPGQTEEITCMDTVGGKWPSTGLKGLTITAEATF